MYAVQVSCVRYTSASNIHAVQSSKSPLYSACRRQKGVDTTYYIQPRTDVFTCIYIYVYIYICMLSLYIRIQIFIYICIYIYVCIFSAL